MNKLLFLLLGLISYPCFGQDAFFLSGNVGVGISNVNERTTDPDIEQPTNLFSSAFTMNLGYQLRNIRFISGFSFFRTGYIRRNYTSLYVPPALYETDAYTLFYHLAMPVRVATVMSIGKNLSLVPQFGVDLSYNLGETIKYKNQAKTITYIVDNIEFNNTYKRTSIFAAADAYLEYKRDQVNFFTGLSAKYMPGEFLIRPYNISQRNYTVHLNLGFVYYLKKTKTGN